LSQAELEHRGYGVRPDKASEPQAYSVWVARVSSPVAVYAPEITRLRDIPQRHFPVGVPLDNSQCASEIMCPRTLNNWNAFEITSAESRIYSVTGRWNVPYASASAGLGVNQSDSSATWVGIDGDTNLYPTSTDLAQGGTAQVVAYVFFNGVPSNPLETAYAWTELLPNQKDEAIISNFWIYPGDDVYVSCGVVINMNCSISDFTTSSEINVPTPLGGTTVPGMTAEWVMERPTDTQTNSLDILPNYVQFSMIDAFASIRNSTGGPPISRTFENTPGYNITMTNTAQQVLSRVADTGSDTMQFTFVASQ